jgi:SAM-dependent methyltransferase
MAVRGEEQRAPVQYDAWAETFGEEYSRLGPETREAIVDLLPDGWTFDGKRVLDFGCGAGRTLRHFLPEAERGEFWGADVSETGIADLEKELRPPMQFVRCEVEPPLGLEYESFDLIWAISVFTHLTENSLPWLLELHSALKPGGLLVATYMGRWHSELLAGEEWDESRVGMNVLRHNGWELGGPGPMVLMSDWWVRAHWGRAFEILEIAPRIQNMSWPLMRKRDVELTVEDLARPADDPREYEALRHNLRQTQRELRRAQEDANAELRAARDESDTKLSAAREEYERSHSWRLTRPLRAAARITRR